MDRDIYTQLSDWKASPRRKPLILDGARQVGKTHALRAFGKNAYEKVAYFNFEKEESLDGYFAGNIDPKRILGLLSIHSGINIEPENTLIFFDEVQESPRALNSLKYFCEEANNYHLAAAGSLLGIKTANSRGFPVGKVNFLQMYPMSFFEFLSAHDENLLRQHLEEVSVFEPIAEPLHTKLLELLKFYFYVGGMPEAVAEYIQHERLHTVSEIHHEILDSYVRDFAKHAPENQFIKISTVWDQIPKQLAKENKKFIFSAIRKSARGRDYEEAIQWLIDAGLIYKSYQIETPKLPLNAYADHDIFKLFMLDVGLLGAKSSLHETVILENDRLFTEFNGALTENFVAQELRSLGRRELFYWNSQGTAEVDFVVEENNDIYPLEVKAGANSKKKSLLSYQNKYKPNVLSRATLMNLKHDGNVYNYPLYLVQKFPLIEILRRK